VFGTGTELWVNLQNSYNRNWKVNKNEWKYGIWDKPSQTEVK
jgi:plasmid maintenance system antidote protein VapI